MVDDFTAVTKCHHNTLKSTKESSIEAWYSLGELDKVFWLRALFGLTTGLVSGVLGFVGSTAYYSLLLLIIMYIFSYYLAKYVIAVEVPHKERRKLITAGLGSFIILWLFSWIAYNTLFPVPS